MAYPCVKVTGFLAFSKQETDLKSRYNSDLIILFSDGGFVLAHFLTVCAKLSAGKSRVVIASEKDFCCSSSDLNGFKLLWDCMLRIWVPALNCVKPRLLTDLLVTVKTY